MNLATAQNYAAKITEWLAPYCAQWPASPSGKALLTAGSIRRHRPECADVDIVCVPETKAERDLFGEITSTRNLLHHFISLYVMSGKAKLQSGSENNSKSMIVQLSKCQLDLWFATPETWATRLMCRTGSKEHNIWLCSRAKRMGMKWNPYEGLFTGGRWLGGEPDTYVGGTLIPGLHDEMNIYGALGLPYIAPENRELPWLLEHFGQ